MKRIFSLILALLLIILPLASCTEEPVEAGYFTRTKRDGAGRFSVSLWKSDKDGNPIPENELEKIFDEAYSVFGKAYDFLSSDAKSKLSAINAEARTVLDVDKKLIGEIKYASELSEKCDGLYEPFGGALTSLLKKKPSPEKKELAEAISHMGKDKLLISNTTVEKLGDKVRGSYVTVMFGNSPVQNLKMEIEAVNVTEGSDVLTVVLRSNVMNEEIAALRKEAVKIRVDSLSGIAVDKMALRTVDGVKGVYVREGNLVNFKKVNIIYSDQNIILSAPDPLDSSCLAVYDEMILEGTDLYDGKLLT